MIVSALGAITVEHVYFTCTGCKKGRYFSDAKLGINGFLTAQARRLVCLAGGQRSFENAEMLLKELCRWHVSDEKNRQACHAEADRIAEWRPDASTGFSPDAPACEFQTDATKVNTTQRWKDLKIVGCSATTRPARPVRSTTGNNACCRSRRSGWRSEPLRRSGNSERVGA